MTMHELTRPQHCATLLDVIAYRAQQQPAQLAYTFLSDGAEAAQPLSYGELEQRVCELAGLLQELGAVGQRTLLLYPPGLDYIVAFFACVYAGSVAVPAYPPPVQQRRPMSRLQAIVQDAQPAFALTTSASLAAIEQRFVSAPELRRIQWVATDRLPAGIAGLWRPPALGRDSLAFLQYTSGSTAAPKGVMLTHANLLHNLELIYQAFGHGPHSQGVIWLPPYHDMGLIGGILQPLYGGFPVTIMSPFAFLQRPLRWLEAVSTYHGTTSGGPGFAYDLCVQKVSAEQKETLDLSSWEVAFIGAEPIRSETLARFSAAFACCGFRASAFYPTYGLAEATLIASGGRPAAAPIVKHFRKREFEQHLACEVPSPSEGALSSVSCGRTLADQTIAIVDPATATRCQDGQIGEVWLHGPSMAAGYWSRPAESAATFGAYLADSGAGPFLRTGDLGFLQQGELFLAGRLKDLIIVDGRNHYPQDIELTVERSHAAIRRNCCAAFAVAVDGRERVIVVAEVDRHYHAALRTASGDDDTLPIVRAIRQCVAEHHDLHVEEVVLLKLGSIAKTSSGKIQRAACRTSFLAKTLTLWEA